MTTDEEYGSKGKSSTAKAVDVNQRTQAKKPVCIPIITDGKPLNKAACPLRMYSNKGPLSFHSEKLST